MNMLPDQLYVYYDKNLAGKLTFSRLGDYEFSYDLEWLKKKNAFPLSLSLPLRAETYEGRVVQNFFGNLLPEENIRRALARQHGISEKNDYALLTLIGRECAGALSIVSSKVSQDANESEGRYEPLSNEQVENLIKELPQSPLLSTERGVSLSLAGAQSKLPLYKEESKFFLPKYGAPSNCIIKPSIPIVEHSVENELYCMRLANAIGLPCPQASRIVFGKEEVFVVDRYDREDDKTNLKRLHQEDFCQLSGISHFLKYEAEGGPSLKECADILWQWSSLPIADIQLLFRWAVFNTCIGNMDAHGKNISMLYQGGSRRLAPFYDLLSTLFYGDRFGNKLAMSIGGKRAIAELNKEHWIRLSRDLRLNENNALKEVKTVISGILTSMVPVADALIKEGLHPRPVNELLKFVATQTRCISEQSSDPV